MYVLMLVANVTQACFVSIKPLVTIVTGVGLNFFMVPFNMFKQYSHSMIVGRGVVRLFACRTNF